jgi:hypothetical protein
MFNIFFFILCLVCLFAGDCVHAQSVTGVDSYQEGQTIRIVYQLNSSVPVEVNVEYSKDRGKSFFALKKVSGDVGKGIKAGSKVIIWRVLEEVPELAEEGIVFRVSVVDAQWRTGMVHCNGTPTEIVEVRNPITGRVWMDRNLGASRPATSATDEAAYGDLYQWGRFGDGHQCRNSAVTATLSNSEMPGHGKFILGSKSSHYDWRSPQNDSLWQGLHGINNPCPTGYRLPTDFEWEEERRSWSSNDDRGAIQSPLKLPLGGDRSKNNGEIYNLDTYGYFWSASVSDIGALNIYIYNGKAKLHLNSRSLAFSVRCIKD